MLVTLPLLPAGDEPLAVARLAGYMVEKLLRPLLGDVSCCPCGPRGRLPPPPTSHPHPPRRTATRAVWPPRVPVLALSPVHGRAASAMEAHPAVAGVSGRRVPGSPE